MLQGLRFCFLALYTVGPLVALLALLRRGFRTSTGRERIRGWRWHVPTILLPIEWLLPPVLLFLEIGEFEAEWLPVRFLGFALSLGGAILLVWAAVVLGRFLVHEASVFPDHHLITSGPYGFVRHPIYSGYLALLLGSALGMLNVGLFLLWSFSLLGIFVQATSEERLLEEKFGPEYQLYARRTGQFLPRFGGRIE
jgi:protein-S-isoprenylcysteine O-methyltransferase Ste14